MYVIAYFICFFVSVRYILFFISRLFKKQNNAVRNSKKKSFYTKHYENASRLYNKAFPFLFADILQEQQ